MDSVTAPIRAENPISAKPKARLHFDQRTRPARRLRQLIAQLVAEVTSTRGRPPGGAGLLLVEQTAMLIVQRELLTAEALQNNRAPDSTRLAALCASTSRSMRLLGLGEIDHRNRRYKRIPEAQHIPLRERLAREIAEQTS